MGSPARRPRLSTVTSDSATPSTEVPSELTRHQRAFDAGVEAAAVLASYKAEADLARSHLKAAQERTGPFAEADEERPIEPQRFTNPADIVGGGGIAGQDRSRIPGRQVQQEKHDERHHRHHHDGGKEPSNYVREHRQDIRTGAGCAISSPRSRGTRPGR